MDFLASLHPKVVHFPIAILSTYILFEILAVITKNESYSKAAHILLFLGILGALAAVLSGNQAEELLNGKAVPPELIEEHETFANITIWFYFILLVFRTYLVIKKKLTYKMQIAVVVLALAGIVLIYETGEHGGELVYKYGAGTELIKAEK